MVEQVRQNLLLLATQKPEKMNKQILSECENIVIMKLNQSSVKYLASYLGIPNQRLLLKSKDFTISNAFLYGQFTDNRIRGIAVNERRTKK